MTDIYDIPYDEIVLFLTVNEVKRSLKEKDNYNTALNMIKNDRNYIYPDSIIDFIIAYNFIVDGKRIDIVSMNSLAKEFDIIGSNDISKSVLDILLYLHELNYENIIKLISNGEGRNFVFDNMRRIINNNSPSDKNKSLGNINVIKQLAKFVVDLTELGEINLAKKVLRTCKKLLDSNIIGRLLININGIFEYERYDLINDYIDLLLPHIKILFPEEGQAFDAY